MHRCPPDPPSARKRAAARGPLGALRRTPRVALRARPALLLAAAGLAAAALATAGCGPRRHWEQYEETSRADLALGPQKRIVVDNDRGTVRLLAGDSTRVRIEARKRTRDRSDALARELAQEIRVEALREGDELRIIVHYPTRISTARVRVQVMGWDMIRRMADVDLAIEVPRGTPVRVNTRSGDLTLEGTADSVEFSTHSGDGVIERHAGKFAMHSTSGDLSVEELDGPLEMSTTSGDLSAQRISGPLSFESTSGDLRAGEVGGGLDILSVSGDVVVNRCGAPAHVSTTSGDVRLGELPGTLDVSTVSGDVVAHVARALQRIGVETSSGDVSVTLPDSSGGHLEIVTASGDILASVPMALEQATRRRLVGVLGPGPAAISIHTSSGDIRVTGAGR